MKRTLLTLATLTCLSLHAQTPVPATTPWSRLFLRQTNGNGGLLILGGGNSTGGGTTAGLVQGLQTIDAGSAPFSSWLMASGAIITTNDTTNSTYLLGAATLLRRGGSNYIYIGLNTTASTNEGRIGVYGGLDMYHLTFIGMALTNTWGAWDGDHVQGPRMYTENGTNYMFYLGGATAGYEAIPNFIGVAYQADTTNWNPTNWTKFSGNPLLYTSVSDQSTNGGSLWRPCVIKNNGTYYLYYNAGDANGDGESVYMATASSVLGPYTKFIATGNQYSNAVVGFQQNDTLVFQDPSVMRMPDGNFIMAVSTGGTVTGVTMTWSHDLTNWTLAGSQPFPPPNAPIHNYPNGLMQPQSFELIQDGLGGIAALFDSRTNVFLIRPNIEIDWAQLNPIRTNFISGKLYTNLYGRPILVSTRAWITDAAVSGSANISLEMLGNDTNSIGNQTTALSIAESNTNVLFGVVSNGGTYTFTNRSSGAGNVSGILGGQILIQ